MVAWALNIPPLSLSLDSAVPCGLIINELVTNCLKHAFPAGRRGTVHIAMELGNDRQVTLRVTDDGIGLPADFGFQETQSLGLTIVTTLVRQLGGTIEVHRDAGTEYVIRFRD
jgi:two-component sensor histidine kinase